MIEEMSPPAPTGRPLVGSVVRPSPEAPRRGRAPMNPPTAEAYLELLLRSRLVDSDRLKRLLPKIVAADGTAGTLPPGETIGERLVAEGLLTRWQHEQLLEGEDDFHIDKYKLLKLLGQGGMGQVYLAEHVALGRLTAIKVLPNALVDSPSHLQRFYQESRATARLSHPNIVQAYDVDEDLDRGLHYLVMEYIEGRDLQKVVEDEGPLSPRAAADCIRQAACGLAHAHERGLVHRDIKPSNLLLEPAGNVKILDLGIARIGPSGDERSLTLAHNNQVMGTIDYLAPEQLQDAHRVDGRADIYALGGTLFYLLIGHPPFNQGTLIQRMMAHQMQAAPNPCCLRPEIPEALGAIVLRMLSKKPDDRYATATEVQEALEDWLAGGQGVPRPASPQPAAAPLAPQAADAVLAKLLEQKILTPLQLEILSGRSSDPLAVRGYQLLEKISEGRLAGLYRSRHATMQFPVLLRLLRLSDDAEERERQLGRFEHEARVSIQVIHPNVVRTYEVGRDGHSYFFTLENLEGKTLADVLRTNARPTVAETCRIIREAALGLAHLHEMEIVHRNVCPENIWLGDSGPTKLMDLSHARDSLQFLDPKPVEEIAAHPDEVWGSPDYLPPEQAIESRTVTAAGDIYGLGCTLYHALTGRVPFTSVTPAKLMLKHATLMPPAPSTCNPRVPAELDEFVLLMMAKSAERRVRSAALVAQVLEMFAK